MWYKLRRILKKVGLVKKGIVILALTIFGAWIFTQQEGEFLEFDLKHYLDKYLAYSLPPDDFSRNNPYENLRQEPLTVGINTHWDLGAKLDWVMQLGVYWIRTGAGWHAVEKKFSEPPEYDWEVADKIVADAEARGIQIIYLLSYTPSWASEDGEIGGRLKDETARRHWRLFVREIASRYRGRIKWWEIWNEPNNVKFWRGSVKEYVEDILLPAWEELKEIDSENKIVGPSLETTRGSRIKVEDFFKHLKKELADKELSAGEVFDLVSQNVYEDFPDEIIRQFEKGDFECFWIFCIKKRKSLFRIYEEAGLGEKQVVITEFGWRVDKVGEEKQANRIVDTLKRLNRRSRFWGAFVYCLQADSPWAIVGENDVPRLAFWRIYDYLRGMPFSEDEAEAEKKENPPFIYLIPIDDS